MLVYLAGPIDMRADPAAASWRKIAAFSLKARGISTFDPRSAFMADIKRADSDCLLRIRDINRSAIRVSDAVLVGFESPTELGFETIREIEFASACGVKHVIAFGIPRPLSIGSLGISWTGNVNEAVALLIDGRNRLRARPSRAIASNANVGDCPK